jgi:Sel1 repeat
MQRFSAFTTGTVLCLWLNASAFSQSSLPALAQTKAAAERGDAKAQDALADAYYHSLDFKSAFIWYRKAAEQGVPNSQYQLGRMLIPQGFDALHNKIISSEKLDEAIKWHVLSARQRFQQAEIDLGRFYEEGQFVKRDYVESYKWYSLAHDVKGMEILGAVRRDQLILKMTNEQISEGQERVARFLAKDGTDEALPEPSFQDHLKLSGISGTQSHLFAIINNHTFEAGEQAQVKIDGRIVNLHCLAIRKDSVVIKADGMEKTMELKLK